MVEKFIPNMKYVRRYNTMKDKQEIKEYKGKTVKLYDPKIVPDNVNKTKKMEVFVEDPKTKEIKRVLFGHKNYSDYTIHRDKNRQQNYCARSAGITCNGVKCDITSANTWSRRVLWDC